MWALFAAAVVFTWQSDLLTGNFHSPDPGFLGLLAWLPAALAYPAMNALMSGQIPASAQGELQGAVASLYSLSSILGPPLMTGLFEHFTRVDSIYHFPGAPFAAAAAVIRWAILNAIASRRK